MKRRFDTLAEFRVYVSVTGLALLLEGFFTGAGKTRRKAFKTVNVRSLISFDSERHTLTTADT